MGDALLDLFRRNAVSRAERAAFIFLGDGENVSKTITFAALARRAEQAAKKLRAHADPGDRALLLLEPGLAYVDAFLGCLWAGIVAVPAYPPRKNSRTARIDHIVADAKPRLALTDSAATAARFEAQLPVLLADDSATDAPLTAGELAPHPANPADLAFLQYTSGSTGNPRGVMVTHGNLTHNERTIRDAFRPDPDELSVTWLPPYHDMGLIGTLLQPLAVGMTTVVLAPAMFLQRPLRWLSAISKYRATYSGGPDFAFALCARAAQSDPASELDLSCWEVAYQGAERVRPETLAAFTRVFAPFGFRREAFAPCFGLAEATLMVTAVGRGEKAREVGVAADALERGQLVPTTAEPKRSFMACGRPRGGEVRIVDPQTFDACPPARIGEIWVAGPSVAPGYYPPDSEVDAVFHGRLAGSEADWLRTGDLGCLLDGELVVTGRLKDLIVVDGKNHAPEDLEATAALSHAAFVPHGSAAFSFDADGRERVIIAQEIRRTALRTFAADGARSAVLQAVSEAHGLALEEVVFVRPNSLPRTSSGKLRRRACADAYRRGELALAEAPRESAGAASDARSALELLLIRLVSEELKLPPERVDPAAPLTTLGLDSLSAEVLTGRLSRELGREIPPTAPYDHPSIQRMVAYLLDPQSGEDAQQAAHAAPLTPANGAAAQRTPDPLELDSPATFPVPPEWQPYTPSDASNLPARWLVLGEDATIEREFEARLKSRGTRARLSRIGPQDLDAAALRASSSDGSPWDVLVRELVPPAQRFGILGLRPHDLTLFELLRGVMRAGRADTLVLRVVLAPAASAGVPAAGSSLRKAVHALSERHPAADARLVVGATTADTASVVTALLAAGAEREVSVHAPGWFVPRSGS
jgi:acyl-CoA synthetase (AMP-forming)/AMP-acid ligase II/acyl carrier protein